MATITDSNEVCEYGGVRFAVFNSNIQSKPEYDEAGRTTVAVTHTISIEGWVLAAEGSDTDFTLGEMRKQLTRPGLGLRFLRKGFGTLEVNVGRVRDAAYGPKPEMLTWKPVGHLRAAEVTFRVTTKIPECDGAKYQFGIMALNVKQSWEIDGTTGLQVLTTQGYLEIPMSRKGSDAAGGKNPSDRFPTDHVDQYRERTQPNVPRGFFRERATFSDSYDHRRLEFTYVDRQLPVAYPNGVSQCDLRHEVGSQLFGGGVQGGPAGFAVWQCSVSGSITMAMGQAKSYALLAFLQVVRTRFAASGNDLAQTSPNLVGPPPPGQTRTYTILPLSFRVSEELFTQTSHFSLSYALWTGTTDLAGGQQLGAGANLFDIFEASGLWTPIGTRWRDSRDSLEETSFHVRGHARLIGRPDADVIVDLCVADPGTALGGKPADLPDKPPRKPSVRRVPGRIPSPGSSWLDYRLRITYHESPTQARHTPMGGRRTPLPGPDATGPAAGYGRITGGMTGSSTTDRADILQDAAPPSGAIIMDGMFLRWGHKSPLPRLVSVAGQTPAMGQVLGAREEVLATYDGFPIFLTTFSILYHLNLPPRTELPTMANPFIGVNGGSGVRRIPPTTGPIELPTFITR